MKRLIPLLVLVTLGAANAAAQATVRMDVAPESRIWIEGSSNVRDWSCKASHLEAEVEAAPGFPDAIHFARLLRRVQVRVPVAALECGQHQMDKDLRKALKADDSTQAPYVTAKLEAVSDVDDTRSVVHTAGTLTLAGRENTVRMDVNATRLPGGGVEARGEVAILMTDYGIKPPTALFGILRASDRVIVKFYLEIDARAIAAVTALPPAEALHAK